MKLLTKLITLLCLFGASLSFANGPSIGMDEELNPMPQMQQETTKYDVAIIPDKTTVLEIQKKLSDKGFYKGPTDGKWTMRTRRALRKYQLQEGLAAHGKLNQKTLTSLNMNRNKEIKPDVLQAQEDMESKTQNLTDTSEQSMEDSPKSIQAYNRELVKKVQSELSKRGWELEEDGILGSRTQGALKQFQEKSALKRTGEVNSETLKALNIDAEKFAE
ncbi:MAG: peptidoglycan-binding protein [Bacteriovoracaceae bacterium]|nr:peptidoglycan-binding protein [Bacteriovoracaceae bacterium]